MTWRVPLVRNTWGQDEASAVAQAISAGEITMGGRVAEFERRWAEHVGAEHAIFVNSGSSALELAAWELAEVLQPVLYDDNECLCIPAVTWPTTVWPFIRAGFHIAFEDINPRTLLADYSDVVVHLLGNEHDDTGAYVHDGCATTSRAKGSVTCYSTFFSHHLSTGEGGFVCTNDTETADTFRAMRAHGWVRNSSQGYQKRYECLAPEVDPAFLFSEMGFNLKPTEIQAAVGMVQLVKLEEMNSERRWAFAAMEARLPSAIRTMKLTHPGVTPFAFPLICESMDARDALITRLREASVEYRPISGGNLTRQPAFRKFKDHWTAGELPGADLIHHCGLFVGLYPGMTKEEIDIVAKAVGP